EDGIRDRNVTGVQTCALPISYGSQVYESDNYDHEVGYIYIVGEHSEPRGDGDDKAEIERAYTAIGGMNWVDNQWVVGGLSIEEKIGRASWREGEDMTRDAVSR